jgi:hypothetical protein
VTLTRILVVGALAQASGLVVAQGARGGVASLCFAALVVLLGVLLDPRLDPVSAESPHATQELRHALQWSAALGATAGLLVVLNGTAGAQFSIALRLAVGTAVLSFTLAELARLLVRATGVSTRPRLWIVAGLAACAAAPLWLGPLAERLGAAPGLVNSIVAASPITYLAVLADTDYLRAQWFYSHSPMGSLRFDYPGRIVSTGTWMLVGVLLAAGVHTLEKRGGR